MPSSAGSFSRPRQGMQVTWAEGRCLTCDNGIRRARSGVRGGCLFIRGCFLFIRSFFLFFRSFFLFIRGREVIGA